MSAAEYRSAKDAGKEAGIDTALLDFEILDQWMDEQGLAKGPIRDVRRVLAALAGTDVPHPGFIAGCFDESRMGGAVFYLMEPVEGFNATTELPALHAADAGIRHEMGLAAAGALARLGRLDPADVGLSDFGKPEIVGAN